jgi:hypothetical protein
MYACSGLTVASELPLPAPPGDARATVDVTITMAPPAPQEFERPSADVVAELIVDGYVWYSFCRVDHGYVGRLPRIADFLIDPDLTTVTCIPAVDGLDGVLPIVIPGTLTAFLLAVAGRLVLHGSAVDIGDRAVAFVGVSGQGKSTMAALCCAAGATLVSDDLLPLELAADGAVTCNRSGGEIRLREKAALLADRFGDDVTVRTTADDRVAIGPTITTHERLQLAAIVLPRPRHDRTDLEVRRLAPGEASLALSRYERIEGWRDRDHLRRHFVDVGRVVDVVPVLEVAVPWGPPFADDLALRVLEACGLDVGPLVTRG